MAGYLVGLDINDVAAETFSGNASATAFTLAVAGTTNTCGVYILGVHQVPTTDYSVSGTTLTFTAAPPTGTNNICVVYTKPQTVGAPADATVTTAKLTGNLVTPGTLDVNGQELILDADADTSITADTDDQIDIKIGGADDFSFKANKFEVQTGSNIDMNGTELILDADADTSITADTDDQIDVKIAGADDFRFTANNFNVLSGSTLTIDSGATITNSGTATNFGVDPESAYAGVLETNANFVDQVIFGPSVDGRAWNGLWNKASVFSSLMLATIEDEGSNTEINIWDLTQQSAGAISTTPLATVDLSAAATPTAIAACMGYLIVSSEDGIAIIDPHSGAWAERTSGWPRTLTASTVPALVNNDVQDVAAGFSDQPPLDPRTGGSMPCFAVSYGTGAAVASLIKDDGNVWDFSGTVSAGEGGVGFDGGQLISLTATGAQVTYSPRISTVTADTTITGTISVQSNANQTLGAGNGFSVQNGFQAEADANGLTFTHLNYQKEVGGSDDLALHSLVTRTYNTGYFTRDIRAAWLANSKTVDRSYKANTLTENGTVTEGAVESGAELLGYSGFTASNYFSRAYDADLDFGTGDFSVMGWFKQAASSTYETMIDRADTSPAQRWYVRLDDNGLINTNIGDGSNVINPSSPAGTVYDDGVWHQVVLTFDGTAKTGTLYADGVQVAAATNASIGSLSDGSAILRIGNLVNATNYPFNGTLALWRASATAPTDTQIRQMYDAEKGMFVASAECLLQSSSTDAVLDVDVDPLTGKVLVTQTDAITVFDGLVVDSKPTVNSGSSEKGKLWGALRTEQNSANAYVTAPAVDQRQVNEMVRGLASDLPAGVDLSKAKAWIRLDGTGTIAITSSYNIKSVTDQGTGIYDIFFAIPFKSANGYMMVAGATGGVAVVANSTAYMFTDHIRVRCYAHSNGADTDIDPAMVAFFGELENE